MNLKSIFKTMTKINKKQQYVYMYDRKIIIIIIIIIII